MATQIIIQPTAAETLQVGQIRISMTEWDTLNEPMITIGSVIQIGGSLFQVQGADDDIDVAGAWGAIAVSTLVFIYYAAAGAVATAEVSATPPVWDTAKQGWYNAALTKRCIGSIYKDAGGNYTEKTIFINRELGISSTAGYLPPTLLMQPTIRSYKTNGGGADTLLLHNSSGTTTTFEIKKPIMCCVKNAGTSSELWLAMDGASKRIIFQNGSTTSDPLALNPGFYIIQTINGDGYLYGCGVYGANLMVAADIIKVIP